jgi:hypothetical protein
LFLSLDYGRRRRKPRARFGHHVAFETGKSNAKRAPNKRRVRMDAWFAKKL